MKHSDCKNFTPLDAFKGLCRANGGMVMIDSDTARSLRRHRNAGIVFISVSRMKRKSASAKDWRRNTGPMPI